jgi:putative NADH-flavin reductase
VKEKIVKLALIGATGRTGTYVLAAALERGHNVTVLVRDPDKLDAHTRAAVRVVVGDATDPAALTDLLTGVDAVVSALGPTSKEGDLHTRTAAALIAIMARTGPSRFVGVSGAGIDVPGDRKSATNKAISALIQLLGGAVVKDKPAEHHAWAASDLDWTLVRPPRLVDGPVSSRPLEHDAHRSARSTKITRADLGGFLLDVVERDLYPRQAPFVATPKS